MFPLLALAALLLSDDGPAALASAPQYEVSSTSDTGKLSGVVVNGSQGKSPLARAEVVLRAGRGSDLRVIASTVSDEQGRYEFVDLPLDSNQRYLPGVNWQEIHYPGARVRLTAAQPSAHASLVAYESSSAPSPLVTRRHELALRVEDGRLEVTERLRIENPALVTYVGESRDDHPTVTLRLTLPPGFEKVTFEKETLARQFVVRDNVLFTDLPWTPGTRELTFQYRLPIDRRAQRFARTLDLPTDELHMRVAGHAVSEISAPDFARQELGAEEVEFTHPVGTQLPAGFEAQLQIGQLPVSWERYAPWGSLGALALAVAITGWVYRRRGSTGDDQPPAVVAESAHRSERRAKGRSRNASRPARRERVRSSTRS